MEFLSFQRTLRKIKNPLNGLFCLGKLPSQILERIVQHFFFFNNCLSAFFLQSMWLIRWIEIFPQSQVWWILDAATQYLPNILLFIENLKFIFLIIYNPEVHHFKIQIRHITLHKTPKYPYYSQKVTLKLHLNIRVLLRQFWFNRTGMGELCQNICAGNVKSAKRGCWDFSGG